MIEVYKTGYTLVVIEQLKTIVKTELKKNERSVESSNCLLPIALCNYFFLSTNYTYYYFVFTNITYNFFSQANLQVEAMFSFGRKKNAKTIGAPSPKLLGNIIPFDLLRFFKTKNLQL